jgi:hypothetical protein
MLMLATALLLQIQIPADAYADSATRILVTEIRAARERNERMVTQYSVRASQRIGLGIRALFRDRMLWRQELVADIVWRRDSVSTATVVGARESAPVAERGDHIPQGLHGDVRDLIVDPASDYLKVIGADGDDDEGFIYPMRVGGELDYRYAIGGTTQIGLPDGRRVRMVALEITPRRADWRLISGTLWFDADTKGLVRAAFRPARPFEMQRDLNDEDDVPGWINAKGEVRFVTLEYGLYESRWWLPRYMAIDAVGSMGSWLDAPFKIERLYQDYEVEGGTPPDPNSTFIPAGRSRLVYRDGTLRDSVAAAALADSIAAQVRECVEREEAAAAADTGTDRGAVRVRIRRCRRDQGDSNLTVTMPDDTMSVLTSSALGEPILQMGAVITEEELLSLRDAIAELPDRPWETRIELPRGLSDLLRNARYNRIEALSLGLTGAADFGRFRLEGTARLGVADLEPDLSGALVRQTVARRWAITGYQRLAAANPSTRPFGPVNSAMALFAGRDDGEYYRARGIELTAEDTDAARWSFRAWHQREREALVETDASLPGVFDGDPVFRSNIVAERATQSGASLTLRTARPVSRTLTLGAETTVDGATGTFEYGRAAFAIRAFVTPASKLAVALSASAGTSRGIVPVQSRFYLGGAATLRGYPGGAIAGDAFWLVRAEVGNTFPAARLIGFADVGWAGSRANFGKSGSLTGMGVGASFMDGLFRIDIAHGLNAPGGTRLEIYFDGML